MLEVYSRTSPPTTNINQTPPSVQAQFNLLAESATRLLQKASTFGPVIIITNSEKGWVRYSAQRWLPSLVDFLDPESNNLRIVSARTLYERSHPGQPLCWKSAAFARECNTLFSSNSENSNINTIAVDSDTSSDTSSDSFSSSSDPNSPPDPPPPPSQNKHHIISIGDSYEERSACKIVSKQLNSIPKTIKFLPSPAPIQILGQLELVHKYLDEVMNSQFSLDINITEDQARLSVDSFFAQKDRMNQQHINNDVQSPERVRSPLTTITSGDNHNKENGDCMNVVTPDKLANNSFQVHHVVN